MIHSSPRAIISDAVAASATVHVEWIYRREGECLIEVERRLIASLSDAPPLGSLRSTEGKCAPCNISKKDKDPLDFARSRGLLV